MNGMTDVFDGDAVAEDDPVFEIGRLSGLLGVDSNLRARIVKSQQNTRLPFNPEVVRIGFRTRLR